MAHTWHSQNIDATADPGGRWAYLALGGDAYRCEPAFASATAEEIAADAEQPAALLCSAAALGEERWVLIVGRTPVFHNGRRATTGVFALADRDCIQIGTADPIYFSTERAAAIEPYEGSDEAICPRCRTKLVPGTNSVRCPGCSSWYHERDDQNCWSYGSNCALCPAPTDLDAGFQWSPDDV